MRANQCKKKLELQLGTQMLVAFSNRCDNIVGLMAYLTSLLCLGGMAAGKSNLETGAAK